MKKEIIECCICGEPVEGFGHNPFPLKGEACCSFCDANVVLPARIKWMFEIDKQKEAEENQKKSEK